VAVASRSIFRLEDLEVAKSIVTRRMREGGRILVERALTSRARRRRPWGMIIAVYNDDGR
jgi:hypothetical protein